MSKVTSKPGTMLYPVPTVMVSCGDGEKDNIITIGCQAVGNMLAKELISAYRDCEDVYNERSGKKVDAIVAYEQSH